MKIPFGLSLAAILLPGGCSLICTPLVLPAIWDVQFWQTPTSDPEWLLYVFLYFGGFAVSIFFGWEVLQLDRTVPQNEKAGAIVRWVARLAVLTAIIVIISVFSLLIWVSYNV